MGLAIASLGAASIAAQTDGQTQPAPTPVVKRRSFDQFDLAGGVQLPAREVPAAIKTDAAQASTEQVDAATYDGVMQMINYAAAVERQYRATDGQPRSSGAYFDPESVLKRKIEAIYSIAELQKTGLFGSRLSNDENLGILKKNQSIVEDMMSIMALMKDDIEPYAGKLRLMSERYGVRPWNGAGGPANLVRRQRLLEAALAKINGNFARLKANIVELPAAPVENCQ